MTTTRTFKRRGGRFLPALLAAVLCAGLPVTAGHADGEGSSGRARFLVVFREQPDLAAAARTNDRSARRLAVYQTERGLAERAQSTVRSLLAEAEGAGRVGDVTPLWIVNAIAFEGEIGVAATIRERPEVDHVTTDSVVHVDPSPGGPPQARLGTVEWNVAKIRGPEVWATGINGSGVLIGTVDTGAAHQHGAIAAQYRGRTAAGFEHRGSWFDAVEGTAAPADANGHGTHVLGTALGGDGPGPLLEDVGVAYGAKWVSARAFDAQGEGSVSSVLLASQWLQAPTGADGLPDPSLAPDVGLGAWAGEGCNPLFRGIATSWQTADILPVFAAGNRGSLPGSDRVGSPADAPDAIAATATDSSDTVASFARVGPSCWADATGDFTKPDVAAPGVNVRSASPGGGYAVLSGTSMAAPHVAGTFALMLDAARRTGQSWTAADLRQTLRHTAADLETPLCDDRTGCGRIDAKSAVQRISAGGIIEGLVTDALSGAPLAGATVSATSSDPHDGATTTSGANGRYQLNGLLGTYEVHGSAFGYEASDGQTMVLPGQSSAVNFALAPLPRGTIEGRITNALTGEAVPGAAVRLEDTPIGSQVTDPAGRYRFIDVPEGTRVVSAAFDACLQGRRETVDLAGGSTLVADLALAPVRDGSYSCARTPGRWTGGTTAIDAAGDDGWTAVDLPFPFSYYGAARDAVFVSTNGVLRFDEGSAQFENGALPSESAPNLAVYALWDDLWVDGRAQVLTTATDDTFVIEWRDAAFVYAPQDRTSFEAILHRDGDVELQWSGGSASARGGSATVGIEGVAGSSALEYLSNEAALPAGEGIVFSPLASPAVLTGVATDGSNPVEGVVVQATAGPESRSTTTGPDGRYRLPLAPGAWSLSASKFGYADATDAVTLASAQPASRDLVLTALPRQTLSGRVTDTVTGAPLGGIRVVATGGDADPMATAGDGTYSFSLPAGTYRVTASPSGRCATTASADIVLSAGGTTQDLSVAPRRDGFGYACSEAFGASWIDATDRLTLSGDDAALDVSLPFAFPFYGSPRNHMFVSTNGLISFGDASAVFDNAPIPSASLPDDAIMAFWDDLLVDHKSSVLTKTLPDAFVIEWRNAIVRGAGTARATFEAVLHRDGIIDLAYRSGAGASPRGSSATTGLEGPAGQNGFQYSYAETALEPGLRVTFFPGAHPLSGFVRDSATGAPIPGAEVSAIGAGGVLADQAVSDADGAYRLLLRPGTYTLRAVAFGYAQGERTGIAVAGPASANLSLDALPRYLLSGVVRNAGTSQPLRGASVYLVGAPVAPVATDSDGRYAFLLPEGTYTVATGGRCRGDTSGSAAVTTSGGVLDLALPALADDSYHCEDAEVQWVPGVATLPLSGDDASLLVPLPFEVSPYGRTSRFAWITTNGSIRFDSGDAAPPTASSQIPSATSPRLSADPLWADLAADGASRISAAVVGTDVVVIEWRDMILKGTSSRVTFEALLTSDGEIAFQYAAVPSTSPVPILVGIESNDGTHGLRYPGLPIPGTRLRFIPGSG